MAKLGALVKQIGELKANDKVKKLPKVVKGIFTEASKRVESMLAEARPKLEEVTPSPLSFDLAEVRTGGNGGPGPGARGPGSQEVNTAFKAADEAMANIKGLI